MQDREKKKSSRENEISGKVPQGARRRSSIHLSIYAMFLAISMILGYVEAQLPTPIPIPGVKLGLANLVNILMLFSVGPFPTAIIGFLRIILLSLLFGNALTLSYSLSGFLCSFLMMLLFKNLLHFSTVSVSLIGGIFHNIGLSSEKHGALVLSPVFTDCRLCCRCSNRDFRGRLNETPEAFLSAIFLVREAL